MFVTKNRYCGKKRDNKRKQKKTKVVSKEAEVARESPRTYAGPFS